MNKVIKTNISHIGDPMIVYHEGKYFMYCTCLNSARYHVFVSDDCVNFTDEGEVLREGDTFGLNCFWAPEVYFHENKWYMIYSSRGKDEIMHVQLAVSDSPYGPFKDINKEPLLNLKDKSTIDGHIFFDDDERIYLFFSMDCSTNIINGCHTSQIYACELNSSLNKIISPLKLISSPDQNWEFLSGDEWRWNEGPFVLKHNGKYYLNYSTNFYASKAYSVGCSVSNNIFGPYKKFDEPIMSFIDGEISGPGHNAFFIDKDGSLKCSFHIHEDYNNPSDCRRACLCGAHFENDNLVIDYK